MMFSLSDFATSRVATTLPRMLSQFRKAVLIPAAAAAFMGFGFAESVHASNIVLLPNSGAGILGNGADSAPGFSNGSWSNDPTTSNGKAEVYIPASALFNHAVTIGDIASISFWTKTSAPVDGSNPNDWYLTIYTAPTGTGDEKSWYHSSLTAEPYLSHGPAQTVSGWEQWSSSGTNQLTFNDHIASGNFGTHSDPTLATIQSTGAWSRTYSTDVISLFSFQTGSGWNSLFNGSVDGLTVTLRTGETATANFEAVPEPSSLALLGLGGIGWAVKSYRRRRQNA